MKTFYLLPGYLTGAEDYYTHIHNVPIPSGNSPVNPETDILRNLYDGTLETKVYSGLDLWDNNEPVRDEHGTYSTHLFTHKAQTIIKQHDVKKVTFNSNSKCYYFVCIFLTMHVEIYFCINAWV